MGILKENTIQSLPAVLLGLLMIAGVRTNAPLKTASAPTELPKVNVLGLQAQALELSVTRGPAADATSAHQKEIAKQVLATVKAEIPKQYKNRAFEIARAVIIEANHHMMDPFFLLAVIKTESSFRVKARGRHGEVGLMQIMPQTARWIAAQAGMEPNHIDLEDPATNIRLGATYFASLRRAFNGYGSRYIAAYNMGPANVRKLTAANIEPVVYPSKVLRNYQGFYRKLDSSISTENIAKGKGKVKSKKLPKLESRNDKSPTCKSTFCPTSRFQSSMPNWTST